MSKLYLIIGIPGAGKSTLANKIIAEHPNTIIKHYEADMYFIRNGEYNFDPKKLFYAHKWCKTKAEQAMIDNYDVIISNTSLTPSERKPYIELAKKYNYDIEVITCNGNYNNIHNVPIETIERMKNKFIPYSQEELN